MFPEVISTMQAELRRLEEELADVEASRKRRRVKFGGSGRSSAWPVAREGVDNINWRHLRNSVLCPPDPLVSIHEYRNDFVKVFCELMQFWQLGTSIFLRGLHLLYCDVQVYERWPVWDWSTMRTGKKEEALGATIARRKRGP